MTELPDVIVGVKEVDVRDGVGDGDDDETSPPGVGDVEVTVETS